MTPTDPTAPAEALPDHTQLPDKDGAIVTNYQEHPQSALLTSSLLPRLEQLHPDGQFSIGQDSGIYWRLTDPPLDGCKAPDWFYVPGVPGMLGGKARRSYVLWKEKVKPQVAIEYVSGDGSEEKDATPQKGKFWVYEKGIGIAYYAIFEGEAPWLEVYRLNGDTYEEMAPSPQGRYLIPPLGVELGLWQGLHHGLELTWLRAWDPATGEMLPTAEERGDAAQQQLEGTEAALEEMQGMLQEEIERTSLLQRRADEEAKRAADEAKRAADEAKRAEEEAKRAEEEAKRAEEEAKRADEEAKRADEEAKRADEEAKRADDEARRAEEEAKRADDQAKRAADEAKRAADAGRRAERLAAQLRALGIDPDAA